MKISGRKNDGAWFRTNKKIKHLNATDPDAVTLLSQKLALMASLASAQLALVDMAQAAGLDSTSIDTIPQTAGDWADIFATKGIPRQVWTGELSFDVYLPPGADGNAKAYYIKKHGSVFRALGIDIRYTVTQFFLIRRQVADLQNVKSRAQGNPGGVADATKNT